MELSRGRNNDRVLHAAETSTTIPLNGRHEERVKSSLVASELAQVAIIEQLRANRSQLKHTRLQIASIPLAPSFALILIRILTINRALPSERSENFLELHNQICITNHFIIIHVLLVKFKRGE